VSESKSRKINNWGNGKMEGLGELKPRWRSLPPNGILRHARAKGLLIHGSRHGVVR